MLKDLHSAGLILNFPKGLPITAGCNPLCGKKWWLGQRYYRWGGSQNFEHIHMALLQTGIRVITMAVILMLGDHRHTPWLWLCMCICPPALKCLSSIGLSLKPRPGSMKQGPPWTVLHRHIEQQISTTHSVHFLLFLRWDHQCLPPHHMLQSWESKLMKASCNPIKNVCCLSIAH